MTSLLAVFHMFKVCVFGGLLYPFQVSPACFDYLLLRRVPVVIGSMFGWCEISGPLWILMESWKVGTPFQNVCFNGSHGDNVTHTLLFWLRFQVEKMQSFTYSSEKMVWQKTEFIYFEKLNVRSWFIRLKSAVTQQYCCLQNLLDVLKQTVLLVHISK